MPRDEQPYEIHPTENDAARDRENRKHERKQLRARHIRRPTHAQFNHPVYNGNQQKNYLHQNALFVKPFCHNILLAPRDFFRLFPEASFCFLLYHKPCVLSRIRSRRFSRMKINLNVPEKAAYSPFFSRSPLTYPDTPAGDCAKNHQKCRTFRSLREFSETNRGLDKAFARSRASALQAKTTQYQARFAR